MDAKRCKQIFDICQAALAQPPEGRSEFIRDACPDPVLRAEVETLARAVDQNTSFLESPLAPAAVAESKPAAPAAQLSGSLIGRYRLLEKLGEGGMGEVWVAEQKEPVRRRVALKLIKAGMNSREVIARFESERQALALMDHPAIAKVLDAGSTPQGSPYFVMEYVAGVPITTYCDQHRLGMRQRLELFMHVCEGVQHAHQKAIIHRDLKPSNILVTEVDGKAMPKIIDFGVAKALTQKLTADTLFTHLGQLVGTPEYMSPEQANSSGEDIDTRTDVYSLGIIFYELLAGTPPLELRKVAFEEFLRRLREEDPPKPSTKIRTQAPATSTDVARKRQTEPLALARQLRGDLDAIALKALEKERAQRYASPSELAADIGRYLGNEAVLAVPHSAAYRAWKFARRHRAALITAGAFAVVLVAAAVVSIGQGIRANREAAAARAVNDFLRNDVLAQAGSSAQVRSGGNANPDLKVRDALDRAASHVAGRFTSHPEVEADIRDTIGNAYMDLGLGSEGRQQLQRALDLYRRVLGTKHRKTLKTLSSLADAIDRGGNPAEAEKMLNQVLELQRRVLGPEDLDTLESIDHLTGVYIALDKYAQAEAVLTPLVEVRRRVQGPEHRDTLASMYSLAFVCHHSDKSNAESLLNKTLELQRRVLGPADPDTIETMNDLAYFYLEKGQLTEAEALERETFEMRRRSEGPDHPDTAVSAEYLGRILYGQGKLAEAEAMFAEEVRIKKKALGPENPSTQEAVRWLAAMYARQERYPEAEQLYKQTLEIQRRVLGPGNPGLLNLLGGMAFMYRRWGKYALAEDLSAEALSIIRRAGDSEGSAKFWELELAAAYCPDKKFTQCETLARDVFDYRRKKKEDGWASFRAESFLGASLAGQTKYDEAEPLLLEGYRGMTEQLDKKNGEQKAELQFVHQSLVQLYQAWGKPDEAVRWMRK